jgi:hypothetical protein
MLFVPRNTGSLFNDSELPIYQQSWLVEISERHNSAQKVTVVENGEIVGSLVVSPRKNAIGMKQAYNLPWARLGGPVIAEGTSKNRREQIIRQLIELLPPNVSYFLTLATQLDYNIFLAAGFKPDLEDNYYFPPARPATVQSGFSKMTRRHIRKAQEQMTVSTTSPASFIRIYENDLSLRRRKPSAPLAIAHDVLEEAMRRGQARITTACHRDTGEIDAAVACLWDATNYYYWMTTRRVAVEGQRRPHQGAVKLLLWTAVQDAHARDLTFDFDGAASGRSGVARLYNEMGAQKTVRFRVKRETRTERVVSWFRKPTKLFIRNTFGTVMTLRLNS